MMASGSGIDTTKIAKTTLEELMLHDIDQDLQIVNSEKINPIENTNGHPLAKLCVKDMKYYISMRMQDMKKLL